MGGARRGVGRGWDGAGSWGREVGEWGCERCERRGERRGEGEEAEGGEGECVRV